MYFLPFYPIHFCFCFFPFLNYLVHSSMPCVRQIFVFVSQSHRNPSKYGLFTDKHPLLLEAVKSLQLLRFIAIILDIDLRC